MNQGRDASGISRGAWDGAGLRLGSAVGLVMLAVASSACADNESSLFIKQVQVPDQSSCVTSPDPSGLFRGRGQLDAAIRGEYFAQLLVGNQVVARGDTEQLRTETSKISLYEYDVRILNASGDVFEGGEFTAPTSGFVDQKTGDSEAYGLAGAILIDANTASALGGAAAGGFVQEVVSEVIVRGRTLGGNEIESGPFAFPISICSGCSVVFPPGVSDEVSVTACDLDGESELEPNCYPGQDGPTDCRLCRSFNPALCDPPL